MSEEKVLQHTHKAIDVLINKELTWKEKLRSFLEEIAVIVIAVTFTLFFHNWNDRHQEKEIERHFLKGISADLELEARSISASIKSYDPTLLYYRTLISQIEAKKLNTAYVDSLSGQLQNTLYLTYDDGRFESFKSSGNLRLIENEDLLRKITNMYGTQLPFQRQIDQYTFQTRSADYNRYIGIPLMSEDAAGKLSKILSQPQVKYQIFYYSFVLEERKARKLELIKKLENLSKEIKKTL